MRLCGRYCRMTPCAEGCNSRPIQTNRLRSCGRRSRRPSHRRVAVAAAFAAGDTRKAVTVLDIEAYKAAFLTIRDGMSQTEFSNNITAAFRKLGYSGGASVQIGIYSALPHGSITPQTIREGDVVMVDGGTSCEGYASDITRTFVVGKANKRQTEVWNVEKKAQDAAFAAIKIGAPCEQVDAAARAVIEQAGFSKNYKLPGLPHRTGHGIGLEGHEWTNFVKGNKTPIAVGMCFSNEPTISIPGEFGIRLEDCLYISEEGPRFFSKQSISIDQPFG